MTPSVYPKEASAERRIRFIGSNRRNVLQCIVLFLLAVAATVPVYEMGFEDDWSYGHIARDFAATGHVVYNGWTAAMLLPQIVWAALFIKVFGFSFLALRLSTLTLVVALIPVLYYLFLECGTGSFFRGVRDIAHRALAVGPADDGNLRFPTCRLSFSSRSVSTGGIKSWKAPDTKGCAVWGWLTALTGYWPDWTVRFTGWRRCCFSLWWRGSAARRHAKRSISVWPGFVRSWSSHISQKWFQSKPYTLTEHTLHQWKHGPHRQILSDSLSTVIDLALTAGLILLPVLVAYVKPAWQAISRQRAVLLLAGVLLVTIAAIPNHSVATMGNIITEYGIQTTWPLGTPPTTTRLSVIGIPFRVLSGEVRDLLTGIVLFFVACCIVAIWKWRKSRMVEQPCHSRAGTRRLVRGHLASLARNSLRRHAGV